MKRSGFLSNAESRELCLSFGTSVYNYSYYVQQGITRFSFNYLAYHTFQAPYASSITKPDLSVERLGQELPTVVVESGWSEITARLHRDIRLWLVGGAGEVQSAIFPKCTKHAAGTIQASSKYGA